MYSLMPQAATIAVLVDPANIPQTATERATVQDALVVSGETFFLTQRNRLVELAAHHAVPAIYAYREFPVAGGLMSYGGDYTEPFRLLGVYAGRILKGEKPADLPVQQATKVELVINLKTAKTLGLSIPLPLLGRADQVI